MQYDVLGAQVLINSNSKLADHGILAKEKALLYNGSAFINAGQYLKRS